MAELKPCPFCGSRNLDCTETEGNYSESKTLIIYCTNCPCGLEDYTMKPEQIKKAWNTRTK